MDQVRVLRIVEYVGPRDLVEEQIRNSVHGTKVVQPRGFGEAMTISAATIGEFPEILEKDKWNE